MWQLSQISEKSQMSQSNICETFLVLFKTTVTCSCLVSKPTLVNKLGLTIVKADFSYHIFIKSMFEKWNWWSWCLHSCFCYVKTCCFCSIPIRYTYQAFSFRKLGCTFTTSSLPLIIKSGAFCHAPFAIDWRITSKHSAW